MRPRDGAAPDRYSAAQIALHWTIAALIVVQLVYNEPMQDAFDDRLDDGGGLAGGALVHMVLGSTVLLLALVRVAIRLRRGAPPPHDDKARLLAWAGQATHLALYGMIFAMPLSGLLAWFATSESLAEIHEIGRLVLIGLIGIHVLGALAEHFVFRNDSLLRMFRPAEAKSGR